MFYNSSYGVSKILELMWYCAARVPVGKASCLVFGKECKEVYTWFRFFREVAGYWEDKFIVQLGGPNVICEGDGMFVIGKRKCGVGRWHSKEHVYVVVQRKARKIRRKVVPDKSASVLSVFEQHILPGTTMMVDVGTENTFFDHCNLIDEVFKIPGPIHIDPVDPTKHTQTVESSHSGPKMRLRLARGLPRHNLQPWMDFEDFIYNRTDGTPPSVFKALGDAAKMYCSNYDPTITRTSQISQRLAQDVLHDIPNLSDHAAKQLCSTRVWRKAQQFQKAQLSNMSTQVNISKNTLTGEIRRACIYDQLISWGGEDTVESFNLQKIVVYCDCKHFFNVTRITGYCCTHIIGQLRRILYLRAIGKI